MFKIGIDVGGTFTDFVVVEDGQSPRYFKTPSTPQDPSEGVMVGLEDVAAGFELPLRELLDSTELVIHGTTVATNTLVERKGARVGLITTEGFRDLLEMREGLKEDRCNLRMTPLAPLVPRYLRLGVTERVKSDGSVHTPLDLGDLDRVLDALEEEDVEALAVCFLFSYLNPAHEQMAGERVRARFPGIYTSLSQEIIPQIKEFDRLSTTVINSYVGPVFSQYLSRLRQRLDPYRRVRDVLIMQSNGGVAPIEESMRQSVRAILSGPAGGVNAVAALGQQLGQAKTIAFDMGGTSTDISLVEQGVPHVTNEKFEAGWKIAVPMIDIHTLGAGGGSIARVDEGGILHVGPDSAGADPGPACYGKGGNDPTVTDANLVLGYLDPQNFLGGRAELNADFAEKAMEERIAGPLGISTVEAAYGVSRLVSTAIAEGIRLMSVQRGVDPREFSIMAFGGASGLQAGQIARQLQVEKVYIPAAPPVLAAFGMLSTDLKYDFSRSYPASLSTIDLGQVRTIIAGLEAQGRDKLKEQAVFVEEVEVLAAADMRYLDQVYEVTVPLLDLEQSDGAFLAEWESNFHRRYQELFSYRQQDQEVRLVTLRATVSGRLPRTAMPESLPLQGVAEAKRMRRCYFATWLDVPVYDIDSLSPGAEIKGPAILEADFTTVVVEAGDRVSMDRMGGLEILTGALPTRKRLRPWKPGRANALTR